MNTESILTKNHITYIQFPSLEAAEIVNSGFSTRLGGVSKGCFESLNLGFNRGDDPEAVIENFRRCAACFDVAADHVVTGHQTHTSNVRIVTEDDAGKGVTRDRDYTDIDGLITNVPGILLCTSHADCTPLYFVDPVHKAIGLSHSGWKGTVSRIGKVTVDLMRETYGTDPADLLAVIGPCICGQCYEIGPEVAEQFKEIFGGQEFALTRRSNSASGDFTGKHTGNDICNYTSKYTGKYLLDLKAANKRILMEAGILENHITVSDFCTFERDDLFFSHRRMGAARGNMCAFLSLKA